MIVLSSIECLSHNSLYDKCKIIYCKNHEYVILSSQACLPPSSQAGNKTSGCGNRVHNLDKQVTSLSRRKKHNFVIKIQVLTSLINICFIRIGNKCALSKTVFEVNSDIIL